MNLINIRILYLVCILAIINIFLAANKIKNPTKVSVENTLDSGVFYFRLDVIKTKSINDKLFYVAKHGGVNFRPNIFVGDPVLDSKNKKLGSIEEISWEIGKESLEIEFCADKKLPVGSEVFIAIEQKRYLSH